MKTEKEIKATLNAAIFLHDKFKDPINKAMMKPKIEILKWVLEEE